MTVPREGLEPARVPHPNARIAPENAPPPPRRAPAAEPRPVGELIVVSNRLPVHRVKRRGGQRWETSPGGLVSALGPVLSGGGTWIGWPGIVGEGVEPFERDGVHNVPIALSRSDRDGYYGEYSNRALWPLYHDAVRPARHSPAAWAAYRRVNERFAEAVARRAGPGDRVWIHDYHLQLVPGLLRERRPDLRSGFFLHVPFPPPELFGQLPQREELLFGLLGADLVGVQTRESAANLARAVERWAGVRVDGGLARVGGRDVRLDAFPISIDVGRFTELAARPEVRARARRLRHRLGERRRVLLGVDRLDYTKGIDQRLRAFLLLLDEGRVTPQDTVFLQVTVPSRESVREYVEERCRIEGLVGEINGRHGTLDSAPVQFLHRSHGPEALVALYLAADVMVVTPWRDGMNLIAKEYVSVRRDGVLVLSEFAGAAEELREALLVNPHDLEGVARALETALAMPAEERELRCTRLRERVAEHDVHAWARSFLAALGEDAGATRGEEHEG